MEFQNLEGLYIDELRDLYNAEKQILRALPRMIKAASNPELEKAFTQHEKQTREHVTRLERVFDELGKKPTGKKCVGMEGLIEEAKELLEEKPDASVLDAGLISKAQHVEHYEMAGYGTVCSYARLLGYDRQAALLQRTLDEEGEADKLLTQIAESAVNLSAEAGEEEEEEEARATRSRRGSRSVQQEAR